MHIVMWGRPEFKWGLHERRYIGHLAFWARARARVRVCVCACAHMKKRERDIQHIGLILKTSIHIPGCHLVTIYHAQQHQRVSPNCRPLHSADEVHSRAQSENLCENKHSLNRNLDNTIFSNCYFDALLYCRLCSCDTVTPQTPSHNHKTNY